MSAARKLTRADAAIAVALGAAFVIALLSSVKTLGYARDEGMYFQASSAIARWFQQLWASPGKALDRHIVDSTWALNREHPSLTKSLFALSNLFLQQRAHLFSMEGTSFRFPAMLLGGGLIALVYLWGAEARSRPAGIVAAIALASMPHFFFHAHLACFDVPIVALWTLCAYAFWRSLRAAGWLWPALTAVFFGLALDTKHNAWFLPPVFVAHAALTYVAAGELPAGPERRAATELAKRAAKATALALLIGPLMLVALWPWVWHDTLPRLRDYARFQLEHEYYNIEFLGRTYFTAPMPRAYAFVLTAATVPLVTLLLAAAGLLGRARLRVAQAVRLAHASGASGRALAALRRVFGERPAQSAEARRGPGVEAELLWLLSIAAIYAAWLSPKTPIYGGTKHWMTAYPFLALFAGVGFDDVTLAARAQLLRLRERLSLPARALLLRAPLLAAALGVLALASPLVQTARSHPWGLASYTPLVGGQAGAATLGLNRTFWGYATGAVTGDLNESPPSTSVYLHDTIPAAWDMLIADGRVRKDLHGLLSIDASNVALYHHEQHMQGVEYQMWTAYGTVRPERIAGLDGVPVILVYRRPTK